MNKYIAFLIGLLLISISACRTDDHTPEPGVIATDLSVFFHARIPDVNRHSTRAVSENQLNTVSILILENTGSGYQYKYQVPGYSLTVGDTPTQYDFLARITPTNNPIKLFLLANVDGLTNNLTVGDSENQIRTALVQPFTTAGFDGPIPMFGEAEFTTGLTVDRTIINAVLVRSIARADVYSQTTDFTITSVQVYRASNKYQIIPNNLTDNVATQASIPENTQQSVNLPRIDVSTGSSIQQIYLPESPLPADVDRQNATVIVVGGRYKEDTTPTYYRLDFLPDNTDLFGQILRNHLYQFIITAALAPGWRTPDEAALYPSTQLEVEVKEWNEDTTYMVFDGVYYFGVSSRTIVVPPLVNNEGSIDVDTNLDTYTLYWTDQNGNIFTTVDPITLGGSFDSPDELFTVSISPNGEQIIAKANSTGANTAYLLVEAGRLRIRLTVVQNLPQLENRTLNVYGSTSEIGSLGDFIFGASNPGERAYGMSYLMRNKSNFGPNGTVPIQGISIGGKSDTYTEDVINMFDVIYMTYNRNPNATISNTILNWHNATDRRFLIFQFDNFIGTNTNRVILGLLGLDNTNIRNVAYTQPFTLYENAPEVITNGVFGPVSSSLQYRRVDDAFSVIDLDYALNNGISPVIMAGGGVLLGIDFNRRMIFSGDIDLYSNVVHSSLQGEYLSGTTGLVVDDANVNARRLIANMWAYIISVALQK